METAIKVKDLRKAYEKARGKNLTTFSFNGMDFLTDYAEYLLEYLQSIDAKEVILTQKKS